MKLTSVVPEPNVISKDSSSNSNSNSTSNSHSRNSSNSSHSNSNIYYYASLSIGLCNILYYFRTNINTSYEYEEHFHYSIQKHLENVKISLLLSFGATISLGTDIIGEMCYYYFSKYISLSEHSKRTMNGHFKIDIFERFIILAYTLISNAVLYTNLNKKNIQTLFMYFHFIQHLGYITVVHCLCIKLEPNYFAKNIYIVALLILMLASMLMIEAPNYKDDYNVYNVLGLVCTALGFSIFVYKWFIWFVELLKDFKSVSVTDFRLILYISVTWFILFTVPIIPGILDRFSFRQMSYVEACFLVYINTVFNVLFGSLPGRITAYVATINKEYALDSKKNLVRFLCHELRSPLCVAKIGISLLDKGDHEDSVIIDDIESECDAAISLLNNLLETEKLDDDKLVLVTSYCSFFFISSTLRKYDLLARQKSIIYEIDNKIKEEENTIVLSVDKYKIDQIIRNLISNAIKFTPNDGRIIITLSIEDRCSSLLPEALTPGATGRYLVVEVKDSGVGVALEKQAEMFQQFQQVSSTSFGGSGLGLYISRKIAEMHNGTLNFESEGEGKGSSFFLSLPLFDSSNMLCIDVDKKQEEIKLTSTFDSTEKTKQKLVNIIVCDDSTLNRKYFIKMMKGLVTNKLSHLNMVPSFHELDDGKSLVDYLESNKNDNIPWAHIIFIDNIMIKMNGPEATKLIRSMGFKNYIVGVSGNMMSDDVQEFHDSGCSHFIGKPVDMVKLENIFLELYNNRIYICNE